MYHITVKVWYRSTVNLPCLCSFHRCVDQTFSAAHCMEEKLRRSKSGEKRIANKLEKKRRKEKFIIRFKRI